MGSQRRSLPPLPSLLANAIAALALVGALGWGSAVPAQTPAADPTAATDSGETRLGREPTEVTTTGMPAANPSPIGPPWLEDVVEELRLACDEARLRVVWSLSPSIEARLGSFPDVEVERVQGDGCSDRVVVQVVAGEGAARSRYLVSGEVEVWGSGLRAARTLRSGILLTSEDVVEGDGWFPPSAFPGGTIEVEGAHVVRAIPAGRVVGKGDIGPPPLVRSGETIRMVYRARGLELRTLGTARRDGWMGDRLAVRAAGAQHDCTGIVAGPDIVEIDSEGRP